MWPDPENVIKKTEIEEGFEWAFIEGFTLPLAHVQVCVGGCESLTHGCPVDLEIELVIEEKIIMGETELN